MLAKDYLRQINDIDKDIDSRFVELERLKASFVGATNYDKVNVQESNNTNSTEDKILRYTEYSEAINQRIDELHDLKQEVSQRIDRIEEPIYRAILRYRHLMNMDWCEIAEEVNYSQRHTKRKYGTALVKFEECNKDLFKWR